MVRLYWKQSFRNESKVLSVDCPHPKVAILTAWEAKLLFSPLSPYSVVWGREAVYICTHAHTLNTHKQSALLFGQGLLEAKAKFSFCVPYVLCADTNKVVTRLIWDVQRAGQLAIGTGSSMYLPSLQAGCYFWTRNLVGEKESPAPIISSLDLFHNCRVQKKPQLRESGSIYKSALCFWVLWVLLTTGNLNVILSPGPQQLEMAMWQTAAQ